MLKVVKKYPPRGPMQQYRLETAAAFDCFRCRQTKKAKLRTVYAGDDDRLLCNACYGRLLSIFEIKVGTDPIDQKAEALGDLLLSLATEEEARKHAQLLELRRDPSSALSPLAVRFIGTSAFVAASLDSRPNLDWSPAIIGLCKAIEVELVERVANPLKERVAGSSLDNDSQDKDLGKMARYCAGGTTRPDLGSMRHFLMTAAHSKRRVERSVILRSLKELVIEWPGSRWLFDVNGLLGLLAELTESFRNPAAHDGDMSAQEYEECRRILLDVPGVLWRLHQATESRP